jgi:menaquinone-dependent protoporphyrinogen oxidase
MRVLVAYASKRGSTAEIAAAVAKTLSETGLEVDCLGSDNISDISPYDAVVLGSAQALQAARRATPGRKLGVRDHVVFGGRLPADPHGPIEKAMVTGVPMEFRDRRDWDEIRAWAAGIASGLRAGSNAQ